jgi:hypothetical protein
MSDNKYYVKCHSAFARRRAYNLRVEPVELLPHFRAALFATRRRFSRAAEMLETIRNFLAAFNSLQQARKVGFGLVALTSMQKR